MLLSEAIFNRIKFFIKERRLTPHSLATASGIPYSTIHSYLKNPTSIPKQTTILHICDGLGITLKEFYDDEMFEHPEQD